MELELLDKLIPLLEQAKSLEIVFGLAIMFLWYQVRDLKKIVTNGLSAKVTSTGEAVARIEGYIKGMNQDE